MTFCFYFNVNAMEFDLLLGYGIPISCLGPGPWLLTLASICCLFIYLLLGCGIGVRWPLERNSECHSSRVNEQR
jgi:hypothetical protein